jgi:hypothetical protein
MTPFKLSRKLGYRLSTTQKILKDFEQLGLVQVIKEEPWRAGLKKRIYGLTTLGFCRILMEKDGWENRQLILESCRYCLPVGMVELIRTLDEEERKLADQILQSCLSSVLKMGPAYLPGAIIYPELKPMSRLDWSFLLAADIKLERSERERWYKIIAKSDILRQRLEAYLSSAKKIAEFYSNLYDRWLSLISKLDKTRAPSEGRDDTSTQKEGR